MIVPTVEASPTSEPTAEASQTALTPQEEGTPTEAPQPTPTLELFANDYDFVVPAGVKVQLFRDELEYPASLTFDDEGALFVGINNGLYPTGPKGEIYRFEDNDGDGWAESWSVFAQGLDRPVGLVFREGELYVS